MTLGPSQEGSLDALADATAVSAGVEAFVHLPLGDALFSADFTRSGADLLIDAGDAGSLAVLGYFDRLEQPGLATVDGAVLYPDQVSRFVQAGVPLQFAQAGGANDAGGPAAIGEIVEIQGEASATRTDGRLDGLARGDAVFMGDLLETDAGSSLGIRFEDGTAFSLSGNARMVIDELIYDPAGGPNSMTASVLSGTFAFVTGQIASLPDSEGMTVRTPVATIGIRGTTVSGEIQASDLAGLGTGGGRVTVLPDEGTEQTGRVLVVTLGGTEELDEAYETTTLVSFFEPPSLPFVLPIEQALALYGSVLPLLREMIGGQTDDADGEQQGEFDQDDLAQWARLLGDLEPGAGPAPGDPPAASLLPPSYTVVEIDAVVVQAALQTLRALGRLDRDDGESTETPTFTLDELEQVAAVVEQLNSLKGTEGDDVLVGGDGNDLLDGAGGNDSVFGGAGDDLIVASAGNDVVDGGSGVDRIVFSGARGAHQFFLGDLLVLGPSGSRTLVKNVEELVFDDRTLTVPEAEAEAAPLALVQATALRVTEGGAFQITVSLTKASAAPLTLTYDLQAGSASLTSDLASAGSSAQTGTLTFAPGETSKTLTFQSLQDTAVEGDETLRLVLTAPGDSQQLLLVEELGGALETQAAAALTKTLTIANDDTNLAPTSIALTGASVAENQSGAVVGTLSAVDPNDGDSVVFTVGDARFEVVGTQLKLKSGVGLDREAAASVTVPVTATDGGGLSFTQSLTIAVVDVNEAPTDIALSGATVAENQAGALVGTLSTSDPDAGDSFSYAVDDARFEVDNGQLRLKAGQSLDFETGNPTNVTVTVTDSGGLTFAKAFAIAVTDVAESTDTFRWTGNAGNAAFADAGNWQKGFLPLDGGAIQIPGSGAAVFSGDGYGSGLTLRGGTLNGGLTVSGGQLSFDGGGTLSLSDGTNNGTLAVTGGTLAVRIDTSGGAISVNGGTLSLGKVGGTITLDRTTLTNAAQAGRIDVVGNATLANQASALSNAGTLAVAAGVALVLGNDLANAATGTLAGTGTVQANAITNSGTVAPGQSAGTLTLAGAFTQTDTGTLALEVGNAGTADRLTVQGQATLDGTLALTTLTGAAPGDGDTHVLMSATGGFVDGDATVGLFDSVTSDFGARLTVVGNDLSLFVDADGTLDGTSGADILVGTADLDVMLGEGGADLLFGGGGNDIMYGGDGGDRLIGGAGIDTLYGGAGNDRLEGGLDADVLYGDADADVLFGGGGSDSVYGGAGADSLYGEAGTDRLFGGDGDDLLDGGDGADSLFGGAGADSLYGGDGDDVLGAVSSGGLTSVLTIDSGNYQATNQGFSLLGRSVVEGALGPASAANVVQDGSGLGVAGEIGDSSGNVGNQIGYDPGDEDESGSGVSERLIVAFGQDALSATANITQLFLNHGEVGRWIARNDGVQVGQADFAANSNSGTLAVQIAPGQAFDELWFEARPATSPNPGTTDSSEYQVSQIQATFAADSGVQNLLSGGAGNDSLTGGGGGDTLLGGSGDDWLYGAPGADVLRGDEGIDTFYFAAPSDGTFVAANGTAASGVGADSLLDFTTSVDRLQFAATFGFGTSLEAGEFAILNQVYDGANGSGSAWAAKEDSLLLDGGGNLIHDANGSDPGYTVVARLTDPAATVAVSDVQIATAVG